MLLNRLLQFFGGQVLQHRSPLPDAHAHKCPRKKLLEDDSELDAEQEEDMDDGSRCCKWQTVRPTRNRIWLCTLWVLISARRGGGGILKIFFLHFFISQVAAIHSEDEAEVNYMENTRAATRGRSVFKWPQQADCCSISARNLTLAPSSSGQSLVVERPDNLPGRYEAFRIFLAKKKKFLREVS